MADVQLQDPATFGSELLRLSLELGFQSLSKRDLELLVFLLLERDGAINHDESNFDVGRKLRLTPSRVRALRRDAYARWRPLLAETRKEAIERICRTVLTEKNIDTGARHASERKGGEGFLAVRLEHADDQLQLEQAILDVGGIPIYERNREVLVVRFDTLLAIAEAWGFIEANAEKIRRQLQQLAPTAEGVKELLRKDVKDLTWGDARQALNSLGIDAIAGIADAKVTDLLKLVFPFLRSSPS